MSATKEKIYWVPLESSPDAMNKVIQQMGVGASAAFSDVWGLDDELLDMVPQPVNALVFLFPLNDKFEEPRKKEALSSENKVSPNVWHMKQTIGNACGTMAIFHALGNNQNSIPIGGDLAAFFEKVNGLSPEAKAAELEQNKVLAEAHKSGAAEGQTEAPAADAKVEHHYAAYAIVDGDLYELDGRLSAPINHGPATNVLKDGARVIRKYIASFEGDSQEFSVISLGQGQ
ncbi:Ubiquitin carboxyl-terminal hydrolase isozyme L3 [Coemansia sp. RSA 1813]|nr:Ubiquitin carboxyl-terminal hydrolase isozyme L3 [Coemansia sp. RSA 1646]KAJ1773446.1 Ubiquitin carboxyl-terminal hydrolase isozyme L3 [Coemansia sp. RSA 1843]KAJ2091299.1 Ubiquitin carboxyl-terminal hydrolase isozyme L3 [Coemansia sp. RSA 986]KAJ2216490.1 Ubiquitin carboxyl-terminal hydrolase isozyme L3 [Coemansia sp. RSA 487]KAJ2571427.1 Ubiquitin carboxyl-terminal hydrolase isozyme L3 [Coemansia sp. RSA 1813]